MLKRTLFFSNPYHLSLKDRQLVIREKDTGQFKTVPVEDIGYAIFEHPQISFTMKLIEALNKNNVAVVFCDEKHMPDSMLLNLDGHNLQNELFKSQITATEPLKKNLWKQTIIAKIRNQAALLKKLGKDPADLNAIAKTVKSGDADNREGVAARLYWSRLFGNSFVRDRYGEPPNNLLNYGYIILRSAVARALAGSGLLSTLGIHHHNRYNAFCLADDVMEPYRPFVDEIAYNMYKKNPDIEILQKEEKANLLKVLSVDADVGRLTRPLMVALSLTTASLSRCFSGDARKITYPEIS